MLATYSPFDLQIDRFLSDALHTVNGNRTEWGPACNVYEDEREFLIEAVLPGMEAKDVEIVYEDDVLTLKGERQAEPAETGRTYLLREMKYGRFSRSFTLPDNVNREKVSATYKDGVLRIALPKREETKPRRITVESKS